MERVLVTVIGAADVERAVDGRRADGRLLVAVADLADATGWQLKPEGLCRGDVCVPVRDAGALGPDGLVDLAAFAGAIGHPVAVEADPPIVVIGTPAAERADALATLHAPDVRLPTVDGGTASVRDLSGRKRLVVSFASWCGCRYDLPAWQALQDKWADRGFSVLAVAVDEAVESVEPWVAEAHATFPVLLDADHEFVDAYGIKNVPTVIWIDEDDRIVRPHTPEFGDDQFVEFHGKPSGPHLAALERWVVDGEAPFADDAAVRGALPLPTEQEQQARTEYRLGLALHRTGRREAADRHFDEAARLAPYDFTIRRSVMPLRGEDPFFGESFLALFEEWQAAGSPYY